MMTSGRRGTVAARRELKCDVSIAPQTFGPASNNARLCSQRSRDRQEGIKTMPFSLLGGVPRLEADRGLDSAVSARTLRRSSARNCTKFGRKTSAKPKADPAAESSVSVAVARRAEGRERGRGWTAHRGGGGRGTSAVARSANRPPNLCHSQVHGPLASKDWQGISPA